MNSPVSDGPTGDQRQLIPRQTSLLRRAFRPAALHFLSALLLMPLGGKSLAQYVYPLAPGKLDRVVVVLRSYTGSNSETITTNTLEPNTPIQIRDSAFTLTGQSIKQQYPPAPPLQPLLSGILTYNFPEITPDRTLQGAFNPPMPVSGTFEGDWSRAAEGSSYHASQARFYPFQPTACNLQPWVKTGPPIPIGNTPVSSSASCQMQGLTQLNGNSVEAEEWVASTFEGVVGISRPGLNDIVAEAALTVTYYAIYKSRRRPDIGVSMASRNFAYTDGQPLPTQTVVMTNRGGLPLTWTATATPVSGTIPWLKISPAGGTLDSEKTQPIELSIDPTGLTTGNYSARVKLAGNTWDGQPREFNVTLAFTGVPRMGLSRTSIELTNITAFPTETFGLFNTGSAAVTYTITQTSAGNWMSVNSTGGTIDPGFNAEFIVRGSQFPPPDYKLLEPGDYPGEIRFELTTGHPPAPFATFIIPTLLHIRGKKDSLEILAGTPTPLTSEIIALDKEYTTFGADVSYELQSLNDADLALRVFDEFGTLQASSEFIRVRRSDGKVPLKHLTIPSFKITTNGLGIAPEKLILRAVLLDRILNAPILSTPRDAFVYDVQRLVELELGFIDEKGKYEKRSPEVVHAFRGLSDWPNAAVVTVAKSANARAVQVYGRVVGNPAISREFATPTIEISKNFSGRVEVNLATFSQSLPSAAVGGRLNTVQWIARVIDLENLNVTDSRQIDIPIERITIIRTDPPRGATLPKKQPVTIKLITEYNIPVRGLRTISGTLERSTGDIRQIVHEGPLGPGLGELTVELKASFDGSYANVQLGVLLKDPNSSWVASDNEGYRYPIQEEIIMPKGPGTVAATSGATLKVKENAVPRSVALDSPPKNLSAASVRPSGITGSSFRANHDRRASLHAGSGDPLTLADIITLQRTWHFTPPIAANDGFAADLILNYSPEDFPDEPNFSPGAMKLISLNPVTGELRVYDTIVDTASRIATAGINSLEPYYTLGVVGPFAQRTLNFPLLAGSPNLSPRLIIHAGSYATPLQLTAFSDLGDALSGVGVINPVTATLSPGGTFSSPVASAFGNISPYPEGWIQGQVGASSDGVLLVEGLEAADALAAPAQAFPRLLIPGIENNVTRTVDLRVLNPTRFTTPVTVKLHSTDGAKVAQFDTELGARNTLSGLLRNLFPTINADFSGYATINGDTDLVGTALMTSSSALSVLGAQPLGLSPATRLVAPGFRTGGLNHRARLTIVNAGSDSNTMTLHAFGDTGNELTSPRTVVLAPGAQHQAQLGEMFGLGNVALTAGLLVVDGSTAGLIGELTEFDVSAVAKFRTSAALQSKAATRHAFAYFDNGAGRFTELRAWNPNSSSAILSVTAYRADGSIIGNIPIVLAKSARANRKVADLIPASASIKGGSFVVESSQPIYASSITGEDSLNSLTAIPAHVGEAVAPPVDSGPLKADYQFQSGLSSSVAGAPVLIQFGGDGVFAKEIVDDIDQTVLQFQRGYGLAIEGFTTLVPSNTWTMSLLFRFQELGGYRRVIDLWNFTSDYGLYVKDDVPYYYNDAFGGVAVRANVWTQIVLTRAPDDTVTGYADGKQILQFKDVAGKALPTGGNSLILFRDNNGEHGGPGAVARFRLYERSLTGSEVAALDRLALPPGPFALTATFLDGKIVVSWPADAAGFVLQAKSEADRTIPWSTVAIAPDVADGRKSVSLIPSGSTRYFRLSR